MREREARTAEQFGIIENCQELTKDFTEITGVTEVEFDLSGFYDHMDEVIVLVGYDWRKIKDLTQFAQNVVDVARRHGLDRTEDRIEDYGAHLYFVYHCDSRWVKEDA